MSDDNSVNETSKTSQSTVTPAHVQSFSYGDDEHVPVKSRTWKPNASAWTSVWVPVKRTVSWKETDYFDGKRGFIQGYVHRRPNRQKFPTEFGAEHPLHELEKGIDNKEYRHRDYFGRVTYKKKDVLRYISPTE
ncbi:hypothetical protein B0A49_11240 [Cryomyces minteri]|uniref:Uncharacterized protein n=1 Tax=Cryomyces minteri TaxID=331657 RepID=A0A4U0VNM2_9PEZI|nr:hypothetical protein B0A49_11240 [Cryomyces minteri]